MIQVNFSIPVQICEQRFLEPQEYFGSNSTSTQQLHKIETLKSVLTFYPNHDMDLLSCSTYCTLFVTILDFSLILNTLNLLLFITFEF